MRPKQNNATMLLHLVVGVTIVLLHFLTLASAQERTFGYARSNPQYQAVQEASNGEQISSKRTKRMYAMCPPKFLRIGNECYYVSDTKQNWLDAHFECKDRNSKLAEPMKYEDKNLRKFLTKSRQKNYIWIGGNYNWRTNKWQWGYNGKEIDYQSFSMMYPGSSQDLKYHCAVLNPDLKFRWSAKLCTEKLNFICQHKMPFVNSQSRAKVYSRWNATFPNELANEVEVVVANQPRSIVQSDYYTTVNNTTVSPLMLQNRFRKMHSSRAPRVHPSRRRPASRNRDLHRNSYVNPSVLRKQISEYAPENGNGYGNNGNGFSNGNGGAFRNGFNVDIHQRLKNRKKYNEVIGEKRPHPRRHRLGEHYARQTLTPTTTAAPQTTVTTTAAPPTTVRRTSQPLTRPTEAVRAAADRVLYAHSQISPQEKKARRDAVRERLSKLTPEEREKFFQERAKRKELKKQRAHNETIP